MSIHRAVIDWRRIDQHPPPENVKLMICGPSYLVTFDKYLMIGYYDNEFRPPRGDGSIRWMTIGNDAVTDQFASPTHWAYPPIFPED